MAETVKTANATEMISCFFIAGFWDLGFRTAFFYLNKYINDTKVNIF